MRAAPSRRQEMEQGALVRYHRIKAGLREDLEIIRSGRAHGRNGAADILCDEKERRMRHLLRQDRHESCVGQIDTILPIS